MLGGRRLQGVHDPFAGREVAALGHVTGRIDAGDRGAHVIVDDNALIDLSSSAFEKRYVGTHTGSEDDQVGIEHLVVHDEPWPRLDTLAAALGDDIHALQLQPALQHFAADWGHHRAQYLTLPAGNDR